MEIQHCSLFTGIGGFDLASEWIGWKNIFQVEIDIYYNYIENKKGSILGYKNTCKW